jgi:hypothetical protein
MASLVVRRVRGQQIGTASSGELSFREPALPGGWTLFGKSRPSPLTHAVLGGDKPELQPEKQTRPSNLSYRQN